MTAIPLAATVAHRLQVASDRLGVANPVKYVGGLIDRTFPLPAHDLSYANNPLTPGRPPFEPSYSEQDSDALRFTIQPLAPEASPVARRDEATREMRRLVAPLFGSQALRWFDQRSEEWRSRNGTGSLNYGAFFGTSYDRDGLRASKIYYEMSPGQINALPVTLANLVRLACETMPALWPLFTSITCREDSGCQRTTFLHRGSLRLNTLAPLMERLGLAHQLPGLMQLFGLALGGRFELPEQSVLIGLGETSEGPELELYVMLGMLPDVPPTFLDLLALGLSERPRELKALGRWLRAFTPEKQDWPGDFSILSVRTTPRSAPRVSVYLRPIEFEVRRRLDDVPAINFDEEEEKEETVSA
jgi:hypothetical protein